MAATSAPTPVFLAQNRSVLALFQRLRDEGSLLMIPQSDRFGRRFTVKHENVVVPNPAYFHTDQFKTIVAKKMMLDVVPTATPQTRVFLPVVGEYTPIAFETLAFIWYMIHCYELLGDIDATVDFLGLVLTGPEYNAFEMLDLERKSEDEQMVLNLRDLFSILLDAFFIDRRPPKFTNLLLVHIHSPIVGEYQETKEEPLLIEKHCYTHEDKPYWMTLYGLFVMEYMHMFMMHNGAVWSINQGRYV